MSALSPKKSPRILRSGESAVECGDWSFDVAFIYPFSSLKTKKTEKSGMSEMCHDQQTGLADRELAPEAERKAGRK